MEKAVKAATAARKKAELFTAENLGPEEATPMVVSVSIPAFI